MEIPTHYLIFAAEVFITTLGLLIALIYFYIKSDREWQLLVHKIQDELLNFRTKYLEEKERADIIRELLHDKNSALEKAIESEKQYLAEIARLKEEIEKLHQSEKLRSEIANQLITSKIQIERLTTELGEYQKSSDELKETINTLEHEIDTLNNSPQSTDTPTTTEPHEQNHDLQTNGSMEFERLKARADKQQETIRELEQELMRVGYKKPSEQSTNDATGNESENHNLAQMLNESETCVQLLESELATLQDKINTLEEQAKTHQAIPQNSGDMQQLEQMLKESETCNTLLETELESLMQKVRLLEEREAAPKEPAYNYDI